MKFLHMSMPGYLILYHSKFLNISYRYVLYKKQIVKLNAYRISNIPTLNFNITFAFRYIHNK